MSESKKSVKEENKQEINLDEIIINSTDERYNNLVLAMKWAYHLKNTEEYKNKLSSEIIDKALKDVMTKEVSAEEIEKAVEKDEALRLEKIAEKRREKASKSKMSQND
ncbi:MAG: hypothetical protein K6357_03845 [Elusimicrobiota bacterium]